MALRSPLTVQPYDYIGDPTGRPLNYGRIYIGEAGLDPEFNQIPIYLDAEMTKPIDQPIRTNDGFVGFSGDFTELYASAEIYSVKILDKDGRKVIYKPDMTRKNLMSDALADLDQSIIDAQAAAQIAIDETVNTANSEITSTASMATQAIDEATAISNQAAADADVAIQELFEGGGLPATPFKTKALMTTSALADGSYAQVTDDTANNGLYLKTAGVWVKSLYDPVTQVKKYTDWLIGDSYGNIDVSSSDYLTLSPNRVSGVFDNFTNQTTARTYLIPVEPNSQYTISKATETQHYIVLELSFYPLIGKEGYVSKVINDSPNTGVMSGDIQFATSSAAKWISVTTSVGTNSTSNLKLIKKGYVGAPFEKSKNLLNPIYKGVQTSILYVDSTTNPFTSQLTTIRSVILSIKPSTDYTFSLMTETSRFKAILINSGVNGAITYTNVLDQNGAKKVSFTTGAQSRFLAVYYSNASEDPLMQLEYGLQATPYEPYGYKLPVAQRASASSSYLLVVIDPQYDVTAQLQSAFAQAENATVFISAGTYEFNKTLNIPSNARIVGLGAVILKLTSTDMLETVNWRYTPVKTYLKSSIESVNSYLENITVVGADVVDETALHFGICMQGDNHKLVEVSVDRTNWEVTDAAERRQGGNGWGLVFFNAKRGKVTGGRFTYGGYENIGTENTDDIVFDNIFCGIGWRTSFQVHKNSKNIKLINSTVEQRRSGKQAHSAVTFHGQPTELVDGVIVDNCLIDSEVHDTWLERGGIQAVLGNEHNVTITNNTIKTNNWGITGGVTGPSTNPCQNWIVTGNRITAVEESIKIRGKYALVNANIIKAQADVSFTGADAETCVSTGNIYVPTP